MKEQREMTKRVKKLKKQHKKLTKSVKALTILVMLLTFAVILLLVTFPMVAKADDWEKPQQEIKEYPLPYGKDYYSLSYPTIAQLKAHSSLTPNTEYYAVFFTEAYTEGDYAGEYTVTVVFYNTDTVQILSNGTDNISASDSLIYGTSENIMPINWGGARYTSTLYWNPKTETIDNRSGYFFGVEVNTTVNNLIDTTTTPYRMKSEVPYRYPIYSNVKFVNDQGNEVFGEVTVRPPEGWDYGHSKGGWEVAYNDLTGLPEVDTTPPSNSTNNSAWYQKILNAIGNVGKYTVTGALLIAQTTHNDIEGLITGQKDIKDILQERLAEIVAEFGILSGKFDTLIGVDREQLAELKKASEQTDPETISEEWNAGYDQSAIKGIAETGQEYKTTLGTIGQRNTGAITLGVWTMRYINGELCLVGNYNLPAIFGGGTHQQVLSFGWYAQCRTWLIWVYKTFLYVGFAWYLLHQVPNMLKGAGTEIKKAGEKE